MQEWIAGIRTVFEGAGYSPLSIGIALLLGVLSAMASACCTLPIIGILATSAFTRRESRRAAVRNGLLFMAGVVITLLAIGGIVVFAGQTIQRVSGNYWKIAAGCAAIIFGIGALDLFPFRVPKIRFLSPDRDSAAIGSWIAGIVLGGAIAISSLPCNPGIFIVLGAAVLQKQLLWAFVTLLAYAIGFSIPLTALVMGLSFGKSLIKLQAAERIIRIVAGILLVGAGIYLFYTL